jgi:hypothetical protein
MSTETALRYSSDDDDVFSCRNRKEEPSSMKTLRKVRTIKRLFRGPNTNDMKK